MDMRYSIKYLPSVARDMERIAEALTRYPNKAKRLFSEIDKKLLKLEDMPFVWPVFQARPNYRRMVLEDHLLLYTVDEQEHVVKICCVLYGKMDALRYLDNLDEGK